MLSWEVSREPIDFAEEVGNMVIHFSKDVEPVFAELLEASKFLSQAEVLLGRKSSVINGRRLVVVR